MVYENKVLKWGEMVYFPYLWFFLKYKPYKMKYLNFKI